MASVIIPTYNARKYIDRTLSILKKSPVVSEVVIIDSSPNKVDEAQGSDGVRVIRIEKDTFDHGGTRTMAGKAARDDILVFLTQDALPVGEDSIARLIKPLLDQEDIAAVYGRQLPYPDATVFATHLRHFNYPKDSCVKALEDKETMGIKAAFISNSFSAYKRSALDKIGWFTEGLMMGEDVTAGAKLLKAGYKLAYVTDATVYHSHNYSLTEELKRYFTIGAFHGSEKWILDEFGRPEGEGLKFVASELRYLVRQHRYHLLPISILRAALKYLGYKLGRNSGMLPKSIVRTFHLHPKHMA